MIEILLYILKVIGLIASILLVIGITGYFLYGLIENIKDDNPHEGGCW